MRFNILITGALYSSQAAFSALEFARASIEKGHSIRQVFFYQDGVSNANQLSNPVSDEFDAVAAWAEFAREHSIELVACISAAERRGVMSNDLAQEFADLNGNLHSAFMIAGLGVFQEASLQSDRTVRFK